MAQIKKSVVKRITASGTWDTKREPIKTFYKHEIEMENGDLGEYSSVNQEQDKFVVGQEVEYEYSGGDFPKIKPHYQRQDSTGGGGSYNVNTPDLEPERIARSVALKVASENAIHHNIPVKQMLELAQTFSAFILENKIVAPQAIQDQLQTINEKPSPLVSTESSDPF